MSARSGWHGPYWRGAARQDRERKRVQAEGRNRRTPPGRRRRNRQETT